MQSTMQASDDKTELSPSKEGQEEIEPKISSKQELTSSTNVLPEEEKKDDSSPVTDNQKPTTVEEKKKCHHNIFGQIKDSCLVCFQKNKQEVKEEKNLPKSPPDFSKFRVELAAFLNFKKYSYRNIKKWREMSQLNNIVMNEDLKDTAADPYTQKKKQNMVGGVECLSLYPDVDIQPIFKPDILAYRKFVHGLHSPLIQTLSKGEINPIKPEINCIEKDEEKNKKPIIADMWKQRRGFIKPVEVSDPVKDAEKHPPVKNHKDDTQVANAHDKNGDSLPVMDQK